MFRVTFVPPSHFLDFVQENHWIIGLGFYQSSYDYSWQSSHIGSPMTSEFCFIIHTTERNPCKLSSKGSGYRLGDGSFPDPRWSVQTDDVSLCIAISKPNSQVLQDALFDFSQASVIFSQNLLSKGNVLNILCGLQPGNLQQSLDVFLGD